MCGKKCINADSVYFRSDKKKTFEITADRVYCAAAFYEHIHTYVCSSDLFYVCTLS